MKSEAWFASHKEKLVTHFSGYCRKLSLKTKVVWGYKESIIKIWRMFLLALYIYKIYYCYHFYVYSAVALSASMML